MYIGVKGQGQVYLNISVCLATRTPLTILHVGSSYLYNDCVFDVDDKECFGSLI